MDASAAQWRPEGAGPQLGARRHPVHAAGAGIPGTRLPRGAHPVALPLADREAEPGRPMALPRAGPDPHPAWPLLGSATLGNRLTYQGPFYKVELVAPQPARMCGRCVHIPKVCARVACAAMGSVAFARPPSSSGPLAVLTAEDGLPRKGGGVGGRRAQECPPRPERWEGASPVRAGVPV